MTLDSIIRTISLILTPAVMISSCAIFLNGTLPITAGSNLRDSRRINVEEGGFDVGRPFYFLPIATLEHRYHHPQAKDECDIQSGTL